MDPLKLPMLWELIIPDRFCYVNVSAYYHENRFFNFTLSIIIIPIHTLISLLPFKPFPSCVILTNFIRYILDDEYW